MYAIQLQIPTMCPILSTHARAIGQSKMLFVFFFFFFFIFIINTTSLHSAEQSTEKKKTKKKNSLLLSPIVWFGFVTKDSEGLSLFEEQPF